MVGQVPVLQRTEPDATGDVLPLRLRVVLGDLGLGQPIVGGLGDHGHQVGQPEHAAFTRLERLPIRPVHGPKGDVLHLDAVVGDRRLQSGAEHLIEVQALASIDDVEDQVIALFDPLLEGGQVRRRVQV